MQLRPYQRDLIRDAREALRTLPDGQKRVILQAATGAGKTAIACEIVRLSAELARHVLYTVPRLEILGQTSRKLTENGLQHYLLRAGSSANVGFSRTVLAMSHTFDRRLAGWGSWQPDLIVIDEAHANVEQAARLTKRWPKAQILGLSATPDRLSDARLADVYARVVAGPQIRNLQSAGWLVPCRVYGAADADLSQVATRAGDFDARGLSAAFTQASLLGDVIDAWRKFAHGRRTILFAASVPHSQALVDRFRQAGVRALHVDGTTSSADREAALEQLRRGRVDVLCNVGLFVEGLDLVETEAVVLATATQSLAKYLQMCGRGLRISQATGKADLVIIDHGGNVRRHGLPDADRLWTLDTAPVSTGTGAAPVRKCGRCGTNFGTRAHRCPACGWTVPLPRELPVQLGQVTQSTDPITQSKRTPPRPCPPEYRTISAVWRDTEAVRHRYGLPLPTHRRLGYTESQCRNYLQTQAK
jgi:superfamily II DNA or RNA helicase